MSEPIRISADHARRFLVRRHLLAPPRSLPARAASVLTVIDHLGLLQFDPLEVPGARNHDLVLHSRIRGYRRGWCERWLYGRDRRLIEVYNKSLNILPMGELPHYALAWDRAGRHYRDTILREQAAVADAIVAQIRSDGPLSTAAFKEHNHAVDWWWAPTSAARAVMEALFVSGRLGIARREGNRRYYDLIERLVPTGLLTRREPEDDALRHRLLSRYRAVGLLAGQGSADIIYSTGSVADRTRWVARLVEAGTLLPVAVEGVRQLRYILADERPLLDATASRSRRQPAVTFLAPLDPLVWDRRLLRELFGFDYTWEVYVPAAKRRYGYYVLPLLFGDRIVGRIEPRLDRRTGNLADRSASGSSRLSADGGAELRPGSARRCGAYRAFVGADVGVVAADDSRDATLAGALERQEAAA